MVDGSIIFDGVSFSYRDVDTLNNVSFTIESGEKVAVVGPSGSGKSTLISLLMGLYKPSKGRILLGRCDIANMTEEQIMAELSLVPQVSSLLIDRTVYENLAFNGESMERVREFTKKTQLDDVLMKLEDGYNTVFKEGEALSGGQLQRFAIARACIKMKPNGDQIRIMIMDEVTSNQDYETERYLNEQLLRAFNKEQTVVMVLHDLSSRTIKYCDRILVMEGGRMVEQGTEDQLLKMNGTYARLYKSNDNLI